MNTVIERSPAIAIHQQRQVIYRTRGTTRGGVTRLISPATADALIKPFVFLDLFHLQSSGHKMGMHPRSGIATVTVVMDGALEYRETTGSEGALPAGGIEFMNASGGVWHEGGPVDNGAVRGFQLWLALPPEDENGPSHSQYLAPGSLAQAGPARVVIGSHAGAHSAIKTRAPINYLHVQLQDGERWSYTPPTGHDVAWVAVADGVLETARARLATELGVFQKGEGRLDFLAHGDTQFVLGSAATHPHPLVTDYYSVHTSAAALATGEAGIARLGAELKAAGTM